MARKYPRFLFSSPRNTKSEGPFIVHTMEPFIICRITDQPIDKTTRNVRIVITKPQYEYPLILLNEPDAKNDQVNKILNAMEEWAKAQIISGHITFGYYSVKMKIPDPKNYL